MLINPTIAAMVAARPIRGQAQPAAARVAPGATVRPAEATAPADEADRAEVDRAEVEQRSRGRQGLARQFTARTMPSAVLYAMFDRMGGASTSVWKGMHVNVSI